MRIKLFANLADIAGTRTITIDVEDRQAVSNILEAVFDRHPGLREEVVTDNGDLKDHINVLVDGESVRHDADGLATEVDPDAEVAIFPPVSGGYSPIAVRSAENTKCGSE